MPATSLSDVSPGRDARRLNRADMRVLLLWLLAAIVGASVAYRYFFKAFPEAAVDFKVTRSAALAEARAFAMAQGASLKGYQSTIVFGVDDEQKTYLEREVGLEEANRLMSSSQVSVWYWDARFFKPLQKEEFRVRVDPGGRISGYTREIEEGALGAMLDRATALARAEVPRPGLRSIGASICSSPRLWPCQDGWRGACGPRGAQSRSPRPLPAQLR